MSAETSKWLNTMTLIGNTAKRGTAWHYRQADQGDKSNHYEGPVPLEDVRDLLSRVELAEGDVTTTYVSSRGVTTFTDETRKTIVRAAGSFGDEDPGQVLGVFKSGYKIHAYEEWLVNNVANILDTDDLEIGSAGLLAGGGIAWVQVEMPEARETCGLVHRPFITAATSCTGDIATGYSSDTQVVVCDNTLAAARSAADRIKKFKHSSGSLTRLADVREALDLVIATADAFDEEIKALCSVKVTDREFDRFLEAWSPTEGKDGRARTTAWNKVEALKGLWMSDERVTPWRGNAFGVVQAVNTYEHHLKGTRGQSMWDRNATRMVLGQMAAVDLSTLKILADIKGTPALAGARA